MNPDVGRDPVAGPGGAHVTAFHRTLSGYQPTPLRHLADLGSRLGVQGLYIKDESDRFGLPAFKILGASWAIERTLQQHPETRLLVAASAGNHGRAVARAAAQRSLPCRIYLPVTTSETRAKLVEGEGAHVVRVDGTYDDAVAQAATAAGEAGVALIADTSEDEAKVSADWVVEGYSTLFREVTEQSPVDFDVIMVPVGVGSLAAAAVRWFVNGHTGGAVIAVEPVTAACVTASLQAGRIVTVSTPGTTMAGLDCATPSVLAWPILQAGLTGTITVTDPEVHESMRELNRRGLTIGDCGAATLAAVRALMFDDRCRTLRQAAHLDRAGNVLCIGSEGASDPAAYRQAVGSV